MRTFTILPILLTAAGLAHGADLAATLMADGFDAPVGKPSGEGYYLSRGYRANGHLGEDWNGKGGGDTDLGDPVHSIAHGVVVFAQNFGHGWGNVVIVRHAYEEAGKQKIVDSLYGHLDRILVRDAQQLRRGQQLGTIGTGGGLYPAHLHLEVRKDIRVGMARHRFAKDDTIYWAPVAFINAHRRLTPTASVASVPMNTFVAFDTTTEAQGSTPGFRLPAAVGGPKNPAGWKPERFDEMKKPGTPR
jgi:murein DD-endopeptidase MepM/ murein hydrolase activator NlpD